LQDSALEKPFRWERLHQRRQPQVRRLPPVQDRIDDVRREHAAPQPARAVRYDLDAITARLRRAADRAGELATTESRSADRVAGLLRAEGAELAAYDPAHLRGVPGSTDGIEVVDDPLEAAKEADALVVLTDWPQFRTLDWSALGGVIGTRVVVDARNLLDADILRRAGFTWTGLGRG